MVNIQMLTIIIQENYAIFVTENTNSKNDSHTCHSP